jgi:hypothetical protein
LGTEPPPAPGTAALIIHGEEDTVLPYRGGVGSLKCKILLLIGNRNVRASHPHLQAGAYAAANGYRNEPVTEETPVYVKRTFGPRGGVPVVEYLIRSPHGGHTYHGRSTGEGTESLLSHRHGRPLPPDVFSVHDIFARCMWLDRGDRPSELPADETTAVTAR